MPKMPKIVKITHTIESLQVHHHSLGVAFMLIASIQLNSQDNLDNNLAIIDNAVKSASQNGARLIVLPENACYMGKQANIAHRFDELCDWFVKLAKTHQVNLITGTLPCPYNKHGVHLDNGKFFQTSLAIDDKGNIVARYDKIHLFVANVNDGVGSYDEGRTFVAGDTPTLAQFSIDNKAVKVGMMICFDLRFPRLAQSLRQMGADMLVAPSAFTFLTGQAYWQLLLQARAIDSQCTVIGSAQGGIHTTANNARQTWGHSTIVAADGRILVTTAQTDVADAGFLVAYTKVDLSYQTEVRQNLPIFNCHRLA